MADRLIIHLQAGGLVTVKSESGSSRAGSAAPFAWPMNCEDLEDLRWYLENFVDGPGPAYESRATRVRAGLGGWGADIFQAALGHLPAPAYQGVQRREAPEIIIQSDVPTMLAFPWELMRHPAHKSPYGLQAAGFDRCLAEPQPPVAVAIQGSGRLRVLLVVSRPRGLHDVGHQEVSRHIVDRLAGLRGQVELTALRPATLEALQNELNRARQKGNPYHVIHFDGHGRLDADAGTGGAPVFTLTQSVPEGVLLFEGHGRRGHGEEGHAVKASQFAAVVAAQVPVVVLNACQSGEIGSTLEATVAIRLLKAGVSSVVAMAYSISPAAASAFTSAFYRALFAGHSVSESVMEGRRQMARTPDRPGMVRPVTMADWMIPVHYAQGPVRFLPAVTTPLAGDTADHGSLKASGGVFIGRDIEFLMMETSFRAGHTIILTGMAGIGKTELAKAFGRWWCNTGGTEDPDYIFWHSFGSGADSIDAVLSEIGLRIGLPTAEVLGFLKRHRTLLIWDALQITWSAGFPVLPDGYAQLADSLKTSESSLIVTTRNADTFPKVIGELEIGRLSATDTRKFISHLMSARTEGPVDGGETGFPELADWLAGHPAALARVIPRLEDRPPAELLVELYSLTTSMWDARELAELGRIVASLTPGARRLLVAASLFRCRVDVKILADACGSEECPARFSGTTESQWKKVFDEARNAGLLGTGPDGFPLYRLHPALPAFLADAWRAEDPDGFQADQDALARLITVAYGSLAMIVLDSPPPSAVEQIENETLRRLAADEAAIRPHKYLDYSLANLEHYFGYALDHGMWRTAYAILEGFLFSWRRRGRDTWADEWAERVRSALLTADGSPPPLDSDAGWLWLSAALDLARSRAGRSAMTVAEAAYQEFIAIVGRDETEDRQACLMFVLRDFTELAERRHDRGAIQRRRNQVEVLLGLPATQAGAAFDVGPADAPDPDRLRELLADHERAYDKYEQAVVCGQLGGAAEQAGNLAGALSWFIRAARLFEEMGASDPAAFCAAYAAYCAARMGNDAAEAGDTASAERQWATMETWQQKAVLLAAAMQSPEDQARLYEGLADSRFGYRELRPSDLGLIKDWYRIALAAANEVADFAGMARAQEGIGRATSRAGRHEEAVEAFVMAASIYRTQVGDSSAEERAIRSAREARALQLAIDEEDRDWASAARGHHQLGAIPLQRDPDQAEEHFRRALATREESGDLPGKGNTLRQLGRLALDREQYEAAQDYYTRAREAFEQLNDLSALAGTFHELGRVAHHRGNLADAEKRYREALAIREELGDPLDTAKTYHQLGRVTEEQGRLLEAEQWYGKALAFKKPLQDRQTIMNTYYHHGRVSLRLQHLDVAEEVYHGMLADAQEMNDRPSMREACSGLAQVSLRRGDFDAAEPWLAMAAELLD